MRAGGPAEQGRQRATVRIAKADLLPSDHNLRPADQSWAELEAACEQRMVDVNPRPHRPTMEPPVARLAQEHERLHRLPRVPVEVLREIQEHLPAMRPWNFYGQAEMAPVATILGPGDQVVRVGSAGRPVLNVETRIVDDDDRDAAEGEVGEIVHRSPQATLRTHRRGLSRRLVPFRRSGVMVDGYLTVVDRKKDMIKTGRRERRQPGGRGNRL